MNNRSVCRGRSQPCLGSDLKCKEIKPGIRIWGLRKGSENLTVKIPLGK